jgi:hypothetical protein
VPDISPRIQPEVFGILRLAFFGLHDEIYRMSEQVYVQKTGVDETEKFSWLEGLADRLDEALSAG